MKKARIREARDGSTWAVKRDGVLWALRHSCDTWTADNGKERANGFTLVEALGKLDAPDDVMNAFVGDG